MLTLTTTIKGGLPVIVQARIIEPEHDIGITGGYEFEVYFRGAMNEIMHNKIPETDLERITQELADLDKSMGGLDL